MRQPGKEKPQQMIGMSGERESELKDISFKEQVFAVVRIQTQSRPFFLDNAQGYPSE